MNIIYFSEINSTNKYVKNNYSKLDNFSFVYTSFQTEGKGRENRIWNSQKDKNILCSYLIKERIDQYNFKLLSIGTATLVARFLELEGLKNVTVKWPNDVYVNDKKICGILLEGNLPNYLVVGIGLNVNQIDFNGEYRVTPTSMQIETGKNYNLNELSEKLFKFIKKHVNQKTFKSNTLKFYKNHDYLLNKLVSINKVNGIVNGIDEDFNILIDEKSYESGEVKILK